MGSKDSPRQLGEDPKRPEQMGERDKPDPAPATGVAGTSTQAPPPGAPKRQGDDGTPDDGTGEQSSATLATARFEP